MLTRIVGINAANKKESVIGVVLMDGVVGKIGKAMDVMAHLVGLQVIDVY